MRYLVVLALVLCGMVSQASAAEQSAAQSAPAAVTVSGSAQGSIGSVDLQTNVLKLTNTGRTWTDGVLYDYLRLELDK